MSLDEILRQEFSDRQNRITSEAVRNRIGKIREALYQDIESLAEDMEYVESNKQTNI